MLLHKSSFVGLFLFIFNILGGVSDLLRGVGLEFLLASFKEELFELLALLGGIGLQL